MYLLCLLPSVFFMTFLICSFPFKMSPYEELTSEGCSIIDWFNGPPFIRFQKCQTKLAATDSVCWSIKVLCAADGGVISLNMGHYFEGWLLVVYIEVLCLIQSLI